MTRVARIKIIAVVVSTVASAGIGSLYASSVHGAPLANGAVVGAVFGGLVATFFTFLAPYLRHFPFALALLLKTLTLSVMMLIGLSTGVFLFGLSDHASHMDPNNLRLYWLEADWGIDVAFMLATAAASNFVVSMQELVGPWRFWQFLAGHYHRPQREERIFLFLDLVGSTAAAERLGPERFHALLQRLVREVEDEVSEYRGSIDRYIGDAIIVTWQRSRGAEDARCLRCVFAVQRRIAARAPWFQNAYDFTPRYRGGCHVGPVITGEVGSDRKEILFLGDTVNTAARLEEAAKQYDRDLLVSGDLLATLELPTELEAQSLGPFTPRGRRQAIELYAIEPRQAAHTALS